MCSRLRHDRRINKLIKIYRRHLFRNEHQLRVKPKAQPEIETDQIVIEDVNIIPIGLHKKKKVAILGTVPHKMLAPFNNPEFEIWAIAHACLGEPLPKVDRIFEIHKWDEVVKWGSPDAWRMFPNAPVYLIEPRPEVKNSIAFPFDGLVKSFQIFEDRNEAVMTNSISWMIALAIAEGFEEINIYGVNMSHHTEYGTQKPSCEYYLGLAKGMGIKVYVPKESDLLKSYFLYGKEEEKQAEILSKIQGHSDFLISQYNAQKAQAEQLRDSLNQHIGAIENCKHFLQLLKH